MPHTPGPWLSVRVGKQGVTWRIWRNDNAGELSPEGNNEGYACIAPHVHGEANASLIAAAPELLAACKAAEKMIGDLPASFSGKTRGVFDQLTAAISKAEPTAK